MKYFPLVWAALRRKPMRAIVTLLSVTVAFTLFGLTVGLNATFNLVEQRARADRIFSGPRFDYASGMPITVARQIARMPGVKITTVSTFIPGYVQDPKNRVFVSMVDAEVGRVFDDWGITQEQWDAVQKDRSGIVMSRMQAELWHKKVGDSFTIITPQVARADGAKSWTFKVVAICNDFPQALGGYNFGNYDFFDKARPLADQGKINEVDLVADDPAQSAAIAQHIDQVFANSASPTYTQTEKMAFAVSNNFGGLDVGAVTRDIALAGLVMILFLTANVIVQSVRERFTEFATLKAIGFSDWILLGMVVLEAAIPCVLGAVFGVALALALARQLPALMPPSFGLPAPTMSPSVLMWATISAFTMALASAALPAFRLSRMDIATALSGRA
jgi:putative ABC transport system permease protein